MATRLMMRNGVIKTAQAHAKDMDRETDKLRTAAQTLVDNNGGLTSTDEGTDSHVLVRTKDFDALRRALGKER